MTRAHFRGSNLFKAGGQTTPHPAYSGISLSRRLLTGFSRTILNFAQRHFLEAGCPLIQLS